MVERRNIGGGPAEKKFGEPLGINKIQGEPEKTTPVKETDETTLNPAEKTEEKTE